MKARELNRLTNILELLDWGSPLRIYDYNA